MELRYFKRIVGFKFDKKKFTHIWPKIWLFLHNKEGLSPANILRSNVFELFYLLDDEGNALIKLQHFKSIIDFKMTTFYF